MGIVTYKDLNVWKKSLELIEAVYRLSAGFPGEEKFGITSQIRRCAISIAANIAEGHGRGSRKDYAHFITIALGSARELDALLVISTRIGAARAQDAAGPAALLDEVSRMLFGLRSSLNKVQHG